MLPASLHLGATIAILVLAVVFFVWGRIRTDLVALCALLALVFTGILEPGEAFSGFANQVVFVVAGMFIISGAIVRSGLASIASKRILGVAGRNTTALFMLVMLLAAAIGSLVSNTGTVAIMMPIVVSLAVSVGESPSRFLMPLAFMSSIGGMFTLIGNSPNMVVNDIYVRAGYPALTLFSFLPVGIVCFVFGMVVLAPACSWYLARRKHVDRETGRRIRSLGDLADKYHLAQHTFRLTVPAGSAWVGNTLRELNLPGKFGVTVVDVIRPEPPSEALFHHWHATNRQQITPGPDTALGAGDILSVMGTREDIAALVARGGMAETPDAGGTRTSDRYRFVSTGICELVITSSSRLVNLTVEGADLRRQFGLTVLGIQRGGQYLLDGMKAQTLRGGDALLVQGTWDSLLRLDATTDDWVVVGRPAEHADTGRLGQKRPLVVAVVGLMLLFLALNLVSTVVAVVTAAVALVLGGCYKNADEAYAAIGWETLVLIAGLLPIALAMQKTGVVDGVADGVLTFCRSHGAWGPSLALVLLYALASFMNIFISTTPVALLVAPLAIQIAGGLGYDPLPFLMAVATATSMCFASPFSTPANALVRSAGRYTFMDYMKIGLPLQVAMGVVMVLALPRLFPFTPV